MPPLTIKMLRQPNAEINHAACSWRRICDGHSRASPQLWWQFDWLQPDVGFVRCPALYGRLWNLFDATALMATTSALRS